MSYIDFKLTAWGRVNIDDEEIFEKALHAIKSKNIKTSNDLFNFVNELEGDPTWDVLTDTEEDMNVKDNDGYATIEAWDDENNIRLANGKANSSDFDFTPHGYYTVSNSGGYLIEISKCGGMARVKDAYGQEITYISDWFEIIEKVDEDNEVRSWIDPDIEGEEGHYNIPLDHVMIYHKK